MLITKLDYRFKIQEKVNLLCDYVM